MTKPTVILDQQAVLTVSSQKENINLEATTYKTVEFFAALFQFLERTVNSTNEMTLKQWCGHSDSGVPCEVLIPGQPWQKGTVRLRLEFVPDEPLETSAAIKEVG